MNIFGFFSCFQIGLVSAWALFPVSLKDFLGVGVKVLSSFNDFTIQVTYLYLYKVQPELCFFFSTS